MDEALFRRVLRLAGVALVVAMITLVTYFAGYETGHAAAVSAAARFGDEVSADEKTVSTTRDVPPSSREWFDVFWEAWDLLRSDYYGTLPNDQETAYGAIRGVLALLDDQHTTLLDPKQAEQWSMALSGHFEGIGAIVDEWPEGGVLLVDVFEGQPASRAGLLAGDVIISVDGMDVTDLTLDQSISEIRGPAGSIAVLEIVRSGQAEPFTVEVTRERIAIPVVKSDMLEDRVGYIRLSEFTAGAPQEVEAALRAINVLEPQALILDLRSNPGGLLSSAVDVASLFVDGPIVIERERSGDETVYRSSRREQIGDLPLAVLVNRGSASASEIVAGAIQDKGRGLLVGEQTYGKGSVQTPKSLADGSVLRVTTARWFTPNEQEIHGLGLEPDIIVEFSADAAQAGEDLQLQSAIDAVLALQSAGDEGDS
jgi:carboxyl-terminal processing protease